MVTLSVVSAIASIIGAIIGIIGIVKNWKRLKLFLKNPTIFLDSIHIEIPTNEFFNKKNFENFLKNINAKYDGNRGCYIIKLDEITYTVRFMDKSSFYETYEIAGEDFIEDKYNPSPNISLDTIFEYTPLRYKYRRIKKDLTELIENLNRELRELSKNDIYVGDINASFIFHLKLDGDKLSKAVYEMGNIKIQTYEEKIRVDISELKDIENVPIQLKRSILTAYNFSNF